MNSINEPESLKESEKNFDNVRRQKIKKDINKLRDRSSKSKIKEIRKDLYRTENKKIKEIEKILLKLEKRLCKLKIYYGYDDTEYKGIRDIKRLFDLSIKDYYKPIKTNNAFNSDCIEFESKRNKNKSFSIEEYLNMTESEFVFDNVDLLHYDLHEISLNRGGSYIDTSKWLKKATINPKTYEDKCFQYALTIALSYQNIKNNPERITQIKQNITQNII